MKHVPASAGAIGEAADPEPKGPHDPVVLQQQFNLEPRDPRGLPGLDRNRNERGAKKTRRR